MPSIQASQKSQKSRKSKTKPVQLPPAIEVELIEWYEQHEELYVKENTGFRNKQTRAKMFDDKAAELVRGGAQEDLTGAILKRWFASQRTMFVKERDRGRSGDGQTVRTERQKNRLSSWAFLENHIVPKKRRQQLGVRLIFNIVF